MRKLSTNAVHQSHAQSRLTLSQRTRHHAVRCSRHTRRHCDCDVTSTVGRRPKQPKDISSTTDLLEMEPSTEARADCHYCCSFFCKHISRRIALRKIDPKITDRYRYRDASRSGGKKRRSAPIGAIVDIFLSIPGSFLLASKVRPGQTCRFRAYISYGSTSVHTYQEYLYCMVYV